MKILISILIVIWCNFLVYGSNNLRHFSQNKTVMTQSLYFCYSDYQCPVNSNCDRYNITTGICVCDNEYASYNGFCDYKKKSALTGLLLTIFLQEFAPVGRMYALGGLNSVNEKSESIMYGEFFTCGLLGIIVTGGICTILILILTCCQGGEIVGVIFGAISIIISILTFVWYIIDIVGFSYNTIKDQNGIPLYW